MTRIYIAAVDTTFDVFSCDAVLSRVFEAELWLYTKSHGTTAEPRNYNLSVPSECATCYATGALIIVCIYKAALLMDKFDLDLIIKGARLIYTSSYIFIFL